MVPTTPLLPMPDPWAKTGPGVEAARMTRVMSVNRIALSHGR
jgi:hypothetical protein